MLYVNKIPPEWHILKKYAKYIYKVLGNRVIKIYFHLCSPIFIVFSKYIQDIFYFFNKSSLIGLVTLQDIIVKDLPGLYNRFFISYILSLKRVNTQINISSYIKEFEVVKSISNLYLTAKWLESEAWEFFGICFLNWGGNFKMRRVLTDYGFKGYPLRKDFPLMGFFELIYSPSYGVFEYKLQGKTLFIESRNKLLVYTYLDL